MASFKIAQFTLATAVADDGTVTGIAYPSGTNQAFFTGGAASATGVAIINENDVYTEAASKIGITYGASTITLTNTSDVTWPTESTVILQLGYNAGLTEADLGSILATAAEINRAADVSTRLVTITATGAITETVNEGKVNLLAEVGGDAIVTLTMPAALGTGARYEFYVGVVNTSTYVIQKASSDVFSGKAQIWDADASTGALVFDAAGSSSSDVITLNATTTGGARIGDYVKLVDLKSGVWGVEILGHCAAGSNPATPFS
jgi:hypothetical protein